MSFDRREALPQGGSMAAACSKWGLSGISCVGGHSGIEGDSRWPDAKPPAFLTRCSTSCWPAPIPKTAFDADGLLDELKKALAERALNAEMDHHLAGDDGRQQPQRLRPQDGDDRDRQDRAGDPARPAGDLRSAADRQVPAPLSRLRRQDRLDVRPRHERPRDRRASARTLRHRGLARPDQRGHRRRAGGDRRLAGPAAGAGLSAGLLRRPAGQDPRRGHRPQQGGPHRARRPRRRHQGDPRPLARAERGRQVLAAGHERAAATAASRTSCSPSSTG